MYEQYVQILRGCGLGEFEEEDFYPTGRERNPYRYATLTSHEPRATAARMAAAWAALTLEVGGHFTITCYDHIDYVGFTLAISRDLTPEEIERHTNAA